MNIDTFKLYYMFRLKIIAFFLFISTSVLLSQSDTLVINYILDPPFAINDKGAVSGIEIEIMNEYCSWLKAKKGMNLLVQMRAFTSPEMLLNEARTGSKKAIGIGGIVAPAVQKAKDLEYTTAYLKNVAFCITNGNAPDIKTKTASEIVKTLGSMTALTTSSSNLSLYVAELKKNFLADLKVKELSDQVKILDEVAKNVLNFAYVEAVEFWFYLKNNPQKFLKMQKPLNQDKELLSCIVPKGSPHKALFNEFFSAPGGFKTQKNYRMILEKYLGSYMTQNMAIN